MEGKKKVGRPLKIKTPEEMMEWFSRYKEWCKSNPIKKNDFRGGAAKEVILELERPLTMEGFEVFIAQETNYEILGIDQYFGGKRDGKPAYTEFVGICSIIRREIRNDQIGGGMAGIYNPSITARLNNLTEKTESKSEVSHSIIDLGTGSKPPKKDNEANA